MAAGITLQFILVLRSLISMTFAANLYQNQSQSLVMTPQLVQSIRLLQLTHTELWRFVEEEVEKNPLLEQVSEYADPLEVNALAVAFDQADDASGAGAEPTLVSEYAGQNPADWPEPPTSDDPGALSERLGAAAELDATYENVFQDDAGPTRTDTPELVDPWKSMAGSSAASTGTDFNLDEFVAQNETLRDHVGRQIALTPLTVPERAIAMELADCLDETGYLRADLGELARRLDADRADVDRVLSLLQHFDPPGLFARSLSECLAIQLRQRDRFDPAMEALIANLDLLARHDFQALKRRCGVDGDDLLDMLGEIRALDPKPGNRFLSGVMEQIIPDVLVTPSSTGGWQVELNPATLPRVLVDHSYFAEVSRVAGRNAKDREFLNGCLQSANWLTRSLDQRARTIMAVAAEIVRQQDAFLARGVDHLKPLTLRMIADAIGMHESTVSRVTSNKYMLTTRGVFELKYFFSVSIASAEGGEAHSAEAVRHRIRLMVAGELPDAVLSDDDIVARLKAGGIDIARRTAAKYREALNIPSSVQRRREKKLLARHC
jgi:RNA polymerase sigma-54 factor